MASNSSKSRKRISVGYGEEGTVSVTAQVHETILHTVHIFIGKKSSKDKGIGIEISTTPTLWLTSNAQTLVICKIQFI